MTNKALRILIADECHEQLLHIEKLLNRLDYYRIAPIRTFDELALLTGGPQPSFDLLIVNKALALPHGIDMQQFCRTRPQIRNALFYDSPEPSLELMPRSPERPVRACLADTPDADSLSVLMGIIDPPSQWASLKALPWLRAPVRA
ncbi:chemotaxis protein CheY [Pseudomonas chlororaphis subsp. aurantiaca]|uniref:chemotaxis protein CheY n=1 Tax=Pseudomonas chlororaphis TaxID=587753 RepID=UPI0027DC1A6E|nr:chemotaxis protein CheY [Pseudomonas chlororaphis]WMI98139.1 chemotaxis protein CheY [Pseudomonas chlororaphis subsp. aurantiaca]